MAIRPCGTSIARRSRFRYRTSSTARTNYVAFTQAQAFWDSVKVGIDKPPLKNVYVEGTVTWDQQATGLIDVGNEYIGCYSGDSIIANWPKPLSSLGAGWFVRYSSATDMSLTALQVPVSITASFKNLDSTHQTGDLMNLSLNWTTAPPGAAGAPINQNFRVTEDIKNVVNLDPDPNVVTDPTSHIRYTDLTVMGWNVGVSLVLNYEAKRPRSEQARFTLAADLQAVFTDPGGQAANFAQDSEYLALSGSRRHRGALRHLHPASRACRRLPCQRSAFPVRLLRRRHASLYGDARPPHMVCLRSTMDRDRLATVHLLWRWRAGACGRDGLYGARLASERSVRFSPTALSGDLRQLYVQIPTGHIGPPLYTPLPNFRGDWATATVYVVNDIFVGPDGNWYQVQIGHTSTTFARFNTDPTGRLLYGLLLNPAPIGDVSRRSYFPQDRGIQSLEYLLMVARARLIYRARCIKVSFDTFWQDGFRITLRQNATLNDHRLPGGQATGKVTAYRMTASEQQGPIVNITISCTPGIGASVHPVSGAGQYAAGGYMQVGYQYFDGAMYLAASSDITFGTPLDVTIDDGLIFPLDPTQVIISQNVITGNDSGAQAAALAAAYFGVQEQQTFLNASGATPQTAAQAMLSQHAAQATAMAQSLAKTPVWYQLVLLPVVNGPFSAEYDIPLSSLAIPTQIDLTAASLP